MTGDTAIRRAEAADVPALAETAAAAFTDYPWTRWIVDPDHHVERLRALYAIHLDVAVRFGEVWTAHDASGVAAWTWSPAEQRQAAYLAEAGLLERLAALAGARADNAARADGLLSRHVPAEPHWCLAAVAVRPEAQRRGVATRLLAPVLAQCDGEGHLARLETSSPQNLRLYERLGFRTHARVVVPDGPPVWLMVREPATDGRESGCLLRDLA
jgi:ribosomal protein S18 acetylase RimI-like enzyme